LLILAGVFLKNIQFVVIANTSYGTKRRRFRRRSCKNTASKPI